MLDLEKNKKKSLINIERKLPKLLSDFKIFLDESITEDTSLQNKKESNGNIIQAFIKTISNFIDKDMEETTLSGFNVSIKNASELLFFAIRQENIIASGRSTLTLKAVSEIIIQMINRQISKNLTIDFPIIKKSIVELCNNLYTLSSVAKEKISKNFLKSVRNGMTILIHGFSTTIFHVIYDCKNNGINLNILVTDCSPEHSGKIMKSLCDDLGISCTLILDMSIGYYMNDVDCVVVGSNAVCENGGVINRIGTYTLAICAKAFRKPFYVVAESLKFLKIYPLDQNDIPFNTNTSIDINENKDNNNKKDNSDFKYNISDYTPPEFITLLFTDIGIYTPSAVSDELIQMFYN